jgi:hypothetical protein
VAWTVAGLETDLVTMIGPYLTRVGLDGTTVDGTNESLRIPIRRAARRLGVTVAGSAVTDDELATLDGDEETLLDLAELKALEVIWGNWPEVDEQAGEESQSLSQLADRLQKRMDVLTTRLGTVADDAAAALLPGASSAALIRTGLDYPPQPAPNRYVRPTFWYGGKYYG